MSKSTTVIGANVRVLHWDDDEIRALSERLDRHREAQLTQIAADQDQLRADFRRLHERSHRIQVINEQVQGAIGYLVETNHRLDGQVRALQATVEQMQESLNQAGIHR